jgi:hypothetical protein
MKRIIPTGVAHGWSGVKDHVVYLSVRPDPDRILPAGWVYPLLLKNLPARQQHRPARPIETTLADAGLLVRDARFRRRQQPGGQAGILPGRRRLIHPQG